MKSSTLLAWLWAAAGISIGLGILFGQLGDMLIMYMGEQMISFGFLLAALAFATRIVLKAIEENKTMQ